jgi:ribosome-associated heat shock protein Hsp15
MAKSGPDLMRIDKWLWCARFYKTRSLAADAVKSGKILIDEARTKPAKMIRTGEHLIIKRGPFVHDIEILSLPRSRTSAKDAINLYRETDDSLRNRELLVKQLKMDDINFPKSRGRPTKRDRRELIHFKTKL